MDVDDVGQFRFCPSCGRPVIRKGLFYDLDKQDIDEIDLREIRCSCCDRPWIACPCTPAVEEKCRSEISNEDVGVGVVASTDWLAIYKAHHWTQFMLCESREEAEGRIILCEDDGTCYGSGDLSHSYRHASYARSSENYRSRKGAR